MKEHEFKVTIRTYKNTMKSITSENFMGSGTTHVESIDKKPLELGVEYVLPFLTVNGLVELHIALKMPSQEREKAIRKLTKERIIVA